MDDFFYPNPVVLAHRGDSISFPENTMPAFRSAAAMGVHVIETDVHLSADGEIVIWHDETLERLSGDNRKISEMKWSEIKDVNAGYLFTADTGITFPYRDNPLRPVLFRELLEEFPEMRINVDLKDDNLLLAEKHSALLKELTSERRVVTASFHNRVLKHFRKLSPGALTSCTGSEVLRLLLLYRTGLLFLPFRYKKRALQVPEFSGKLRVLSSEFIKVLHKRGFMVQVWTVNEEMEMMRFLAMGVDGIFTDNPSLLIKCLENR